MKFSIALCFAASMAIAAAMPPPGGFGGFMPGAAAPFIPSPAMIQSFIPSPQEIAVLNALHTTPVPGVLPVPAQGPTPPPTMPPAVANLVQKYQFAAAAFVTPAVGAV